MNEKLGKNDTVDSQSAINAYIGNKEQNGYRHKARVLISSKGKNRYSNVLYVAIDSSNFHVIVEGDNKFSHNFHGRYGHEYNRFSFIRGTLIIHSTDIWGNAIELSISSV